MGQNSSKTESKNQNKSNSSEVKEILQQTSRVSQNKNIKKYLPTTIMQSQENNVGDFNVPTEIIKTIFSFLPIATLAKVAQVSKRWGEASESDEVWKEKCKMDLNCDSQIENYKAFYKTKFIQTFFYATTDFSKGFLQQTKLTLGSGCGLYWNKRDAMEHLTGYSIHGKDQVYVIYEIQLTINQLKSMHAKNDNNREIVLYNVDRSAYKPIPIIDIYYKDLYSKNYSSKSRKQIEIMEEVSDNRNNLSLF